MGAHNIESAIDYSITRKLPFGDSNRPFSSRILMSANLRNQDIDIEVDITNGRARSEITTGGHCKAWCECTATAIGYREFTAAIGQPLEIANRFCIPACE